MPVLDYTPTLKEVGSLVRSRTTDTGGNEIGTFNSNTTPNATQVTEIINDVVQELYAAGFGADIPDAPSTEDPEVLRTAAKRCAAYGAAALVELSHFPEQVATGRSPYKMYDERYQKAMKQVLKAIVEVQAGDIPGVDTDTVTTLSDGMPVDEGGLVGWNTVW